MTQLDAGLVAVLAATRNLLLDFDGPVCSIFAGYPAPQVAAELRDLITRAGANLSPELAATDDPLRVLRLTADIGDAGITADVADALRDVEVTAADSAEPTPGADQVLRAALDTGRRLAIVSNNSAEAITVYLRRHDLLTSFTRVIGRYQGMDPTFLKPSNHLVALALIGIDAPPWSSTLVGDSTSDVQAARSVPIACIGYANRSDKTALLAAAGADVVITDMADLAEALRATPVSATHRP